MHLYIIYVCNYVYTYTIIYISQCRTFFGDVYIYIYVHVFILLIMFNYTKKYDSCLFNDYDQYDQSASFCCF